MKEKKFQFGQSMVRIDGSRVRQLREKKGLTQLYVATAVGVTTDTISRWENRHYQSVKLENARGLAAALEVELAAILEASEPQEAEEVEGAESVAASVSVPSPAGSWFKGRGALPAILLLAAMLALVVLLMRNKEQDLAPDIGLTATRKIPAHAMPGYPMPVVITVESTASPVSVLIKEILPSRVRVVSSSATLQPAGKEELKWIVKHLSGRQRFGYMVRPTNGEDLHFHGTVASGAGRGQEVVIGGGQSVAMAPFHWADTNRDNIISDDEILVVYDDFEDVDGLDVDVELVEEMWIGSGYRWDENKEAFAVIPWP
ncbi:MAG: XRE family transcriptional regulator [Desulfobulbaceae bacterium]|nr:MAG: XRE family transcriptional regulator [Desulfobulbaceae bacterium]